MGEATELPLPCEDYLSNYFLPRGKHKNTYPAKVSFYLKTSACLFSAINLHTNFLFPPSFSATVTRILQPFPFPHSEASFTTIHFGPSPMSLFVSGSHSPAWTPRTFRFLRAKLFQSAAEASQLCERPPQIARSKKFREGEPVAFSAIFLES